MPNPHRVSHSAGARPTSLPWVSTSLSALALALWLIPGANELLQFERTAIAAGEFWRLVTGHLTHWTTSHVGWDLAAFALLGTLVERRSRRLLVATLASSAPAISAGVWLFRPDLATYRGLSGIDSALFATAIATQVLEGFSARSPSRVFIAIAASIAFLTKLALESTTPVPLFVATSAAFVPVPLAHGIGAACGLIVCTIARHSTSFKGNGCSSYSDDTSGSSTVAAGSGSRVRVNS